MTLLSLLLTLLSCGLLYLSHKNQQYRARPLPPLWQKIGAALLVLSAVVWLQTFSLVAGLLLWLSSTMMGLSLLPFAALLSKRRRT